MSTETNAVFESDALSPAEAEYFSSRGEKSEGLAPTEPPVSAPVSAPEGPPESAPEGTADDEEGIYLDADGKARSTLTGKFVPHAALHKERERRKSVESENMSLRERQARAEERLAVLNEVLTAAPKPQTQDAMPEEEPDPEKDIFAYVKFQKAKIERMEQALQARDQQTNEERGLQQLQDAYKQDAVRVMKEKPDFPDAYKYIANSYFTELKTMGYSDAEARQRLDIEERNLAAEAFQRRISPAEVIYQRAIARGYSPKQAEAAAQGSNPAQRLETVAKGQAQQKSLSSAGGSSGEGLTLEALANMDETEFAAVSAKLGRSKMRQLMGG